MKRLFSRVYVIALTVLVATLGAAAWQMVAVGDLEAQRTRTTEHLLTLFWVHEKLLEAESAQRAYLLAGEPDYRAEFVAARGDLELLLANLNDNPNGARLRELAEQRLDALWHVVNIYDTEGPAAAAEAVRSRVGASLMARFAALAREAVDADQRALDEIRADTARIERVMNLLMASGGLLIFLIAGLNLAAQRRDLGDQRELSTQIETASRRISQLNELNNNLLSCRESEEAYAVIANALRTLFPGTAGGLYAYRPSRDILELRASWGSAGGEPRGVVLPTECWALRRGNPHYHRSSADLPCRHWESPDQQRSICVPMMALGDTVGLVFFQCEEGEDDSVLFADDVQALTQSAASQIASAVANLALRAVLHQQSVKDPLTGLYNRRFLEESLQRESVRADRSGAPVTIIMVDIDHFKELNDQHGHQAGDLLLQRVGSVLLANVRGGDLACRYGGEEFTLVLPGVGLEMGARRAEDIRQAVEGITATLDGSRLPRITASFGVAAYPKHGASAQAVLQQADVALYRAKQQGRNRIVTAE